ncbi:MAG: hypothetical protein WBP18_03415 [Paracoccaceae bacterium]
MIAAFRRLAFPLALVLPIVAALPAAADTIYECRIDQLSKNNGWLPDVVSVVMEDGAAEAMVNDPMIDFFIGKPLRAKIDTDNAKRITISWNYQTSKPYRVVKQFNRLTIMKADLSASMTGTLGRYVDHYDARGKCQKAKKK